MNVEVDSVGVESAVGGMDGNGERERGVSGEHCINKPQGIRYRFYMHRAERARDVMRIRTAMLEQAAGSKDSGSSDLDAWSMPDGGRESFREIEMFFSSTKSSQKPEEETAQGDDG
jgi:hypothetical protein